MKITEMDVREFKKKYGIGYLIKKAKTYHKNGKLVIDAEVEEVEKPININEFLLNNFVDIISVKELKNGWLCEVIAQKQVGLIKQLLYITRSGNSYHVERVVA